MVATRMEGRLFFGKPETSFIDNVRVALDQFREKYGNPSKIMFNPLQDQFRADLEALFAAEKLQLDIVPTNSVLLLHVWLGAPKGGTSPARPVRVVESRVAQRVQVMAAAEPAAVVETKIALPVIDDTEIIRTFIQLSQPALVAPCIAGLLLDVNPRGPEVGERDGGEEAVDQFAAMVLDLSAPRVITPEYIDAFRVAHSSSEKARPALLALIDRGSPQQWTDQPISEDERIWKPLVMRQMNRSPRAWRITRMLDRQLEDALPVVEEVIALGAPRVLPQEVTMHPRDVMRELATQHSRPTALRVVKIDRSSEKLLEEAAQDRAAVPTDKIGDFLEALEYAVNHREDEQAQLLPDGHRFAKHGKQGQIKVKHPSLKVEPMLVAVQLHRTAGYRFVARPHEARAYLDKCAREFEAKKITPISAGELYPGEVKAA